MANKLTLFGFIVLIGGLVFVMLNSFNYNANVSSNYQIIDEQSYAEVEVDIDISSMMMNIKPFRTSKHKIHAIEKFINGTGKMIMFHYSSCCKNTLSEWFTRIRDKLQKLHAPTGDTSLWNSSIQHIEITHNFHEIFGTEIQEMMQSNMDDTIYIICFGDPVKRILSQYDKEWRWGCPLNEGCGTQTYMLQYNKSSLTKDNYLTLTENHPDFVNLSPTERFAAIDFNDFLYRIVTFEIEQQSNNKKLYQMFFNNYYFWAFCCDDEQCNMARNVELNTEKLEKCIQNTISAIKSFDMVFIKDWIQDLRVQHYVNELFFIENNVDDQRNKFVAVAKKKYPVSKIGTNYMYDPENEQLLNILNKYDFKLFEWAKDLVFNRTHIVWERAKYNKNNRNELVYDLGYQHILIKSDTVVN